MAKTSQEMIRKTVYTYPKKALVQLTLSEEEAIKFDKLRYTIEPGKILTRVRVLQILWERYYTDKNNTVDTVENK